MARFYAQISVRVQKVDFMCAREHTGNSRARTRVLGRREARDKSHARKCRVNMPEKDYCDEVVASA